MAVYLVMPNTMVKIIPAFIASVIVSIAFLLFQYIFILLQFLLIGYNTVYGGFSVIFIFLIWVRICWFIVILGAHITYLIQNANFDINIENDSINISFNSKLYITFKVLEEIIKRYLNNQSPPNMTDLRKVTTSSPFLIESILDDLIRGGYVLSSRDYSEKVFCIAKNIEEVSLKEIYDFIANTGEEIYILQDGVISDSIEKMIIEKDYSRTLKSLGGESARKKIKIGGILFLLFILSVSGYLIYNKSFFLLTLFLFSIVYLIFSIAVVSNWGKKQLFAKRSSIMLLIILFFLVVYALRLLGIQYLQKSKYVALMNEQLLSINKEIGQRGLIYDNKGKKLAFNNRKYTISINPSLLNDEKIHDEIVKDIVAIRDSKIVKLEDNILENLLKLASEGNKYKRLVKDIDDEQKEQIDELLAGIERTKVKGSPKYKTVLQFEKSIERKYYKQDEYEKLIGMVRFTEESKDERLGISGLEKQYQSYLVEKKRDIPKLYGLNKKNILALSKETLFSDLNGKNLYLTIDADLNFILNDEIKDTI